MVVVAEWTIPEKITRVNIASGTNLKVSFLILTLVMIDILRLKY